MLFDFIFEDTHIPVAIKALISRLQIPVLKVVMLDPGFFADRQLIQPAASLAASPEFQFAGVILLMKQTRSTTSWPNSSSEFKPNLKTTLKYLAPR